MSRIISFKKRMADSTQDRIFLATNDGLTGYTINKFELLPIDADEDVESVVKIFSVEPDTIDADINFSETTLLAAGVIRAGTGVAQPLTAITVFDNVKFNQDIYITLKGGSYTRDVNYYLELKESKLSLDEQSVATLKNIRNSGVE